MDLYETKDRIAIALVESIFRRARYTIRPFRAESAALPFVRQDFLPHFHAAKVDESGRDRQFLVEVQYRPFVDPFMALENQRRQSSVFVLSRRHWPEVRSVLVTDHPEPGTSCFQAVVFAGHGLALPLRTVDLTTAAEFGIFPNNVADHEELLLRILAMLGAERRRAEGIPG